MSRLSARNKETIAAFDTAFCIAVRIKQHDLLGRTPVSTEEHDLRFVLVQVR